MSQQAGGDNHAGHIGDHPAAIGHHAEHRVLDPRLIHEPARLVKSLARIPQGIVHPDVRLAVDVPRLIDQVDVRRIVLDHGRAQVVVFADIDQCHRVGLVLPPEPQGHIVGFSPHGDRFVQFGQGSISVHQHGLRQQIGPQVRTALLVGKSQVSRCLVNPAVPVRAGRRLGLFGSQLQPFPLGRRVRAGCRDGFDFRVGKILFDFDLERQRVVLDRFGGQKAGWFAIAGQRNGDHAVLLVVVGQLAVDDRQLDRSNILSVVDRLPLGDRHLFFHVELADEYLAEHQQQHTAVQQCDAAAASEQ